MRIRNLPISAVALALALTLTLAAGPPSGEAPAEARSLDDLTESIDVFTRPDGITVTTRSFTTRIPWDEYLVALAAESDGATPLTPSAGGGGAPGAPSVAGVCTPPDADYDGDGFIGLDDSFPLHKGEYVADRPRVGAQFTSYIEPSIDVTYEGSTTTTNEYEHFLRDELTYKENVKDAIEIHKKYNQTTGIKLAFGLAQLKPTFSFNLDYSATWELESKQDYTWSRERGRDTREHFQEVRKGVDTNTISVGPNAGRVKGQVMILNDSDYEIMLEVTNVKIAVVAYSPFTGTKFVIGDTTFSGPYTLGFGEGNNFIIEVLDLAGLNTWEMMDALAEGWVFDFELAGAFQATDVSTGESLMALLSTLNQRNARISVHYGDSTERKYGQVSVYQPDDQCLTARTMLETYAGADNVEFDNMADGTLVVKRINHRTNMHADRDFDSLTEAEQAEYGRWVVGFDYGPVNDSLTELDLETTLIAPEDKIFFYYITAADFEQEELPPDETPSFFVAYDDIAPTEQLVVDAVSVGDVVEIEVNSRFQLEEPFTQYLGELVYTVECGYILEATYYGHRVVTDSLNDYYAVPDADFYGLEVKFGGLSWMSIDDLMQEDTASPEMVDFRGYPYYDFMLRFRASPELLGDYPLRNLQLRSTGPRQRMTIGYTGYTLSGDWLDCRWQEDAGMTRNDGEVRVWYKIDDVDEDLDTFYAASKTGIDFDDTDDHRFPFAPEHLDFVDNDGDSVVDEEPLICPEAVLSNDLGTCKLDDRMGWYGDSPNIGMEYRWHYTDGATGSWVSVGSVTEYTFFMPDQQAIEGLEMKAVNYAVTGNPYGTNFVERIDPCADADSDGWTDCAGDCDDDNADTYPGALELCDGLDNDCSGVVPADEADADYDGYRICENDCNDGNPNVHPDRAEDCATSWDDDCDGYINEGCAGGSPIFRKPNVVIQDHGDDEGW